MKTYYKKVCIDFSKLRVKKKYKFLMLPNAVKKGQLWCGSYHVGMPFCLYLV